MCRFKDVELRHKPPTLQDAQTAATLLTAAFPDIEAVLLCGSVARGDANAWSDIDLVVTGSDANRTSEQLREPLSQRTDRVSLIYYPTVLFRELCVERALFIAHLKKEGIALYDPLGVLKSALSDPSLPVVDIPGEIEAHRARLVPYADPRRFNSNFLFCLSHLYSIGKGVVMLGLANRGVLQFNRDAAFSCFSKLNPDLASETEKVARLRPFYHLVTDRHPEALPFSYRSAGRQMLEAVAAIEALADRAVNP